MGFAESARRTAAEARRRAAAKRPKGQRTARGKKDFKTGRPKPTQQDMTAAERRTRRLGGLGGGATITRGRAVAAAGSSRHGRAVDARIRGGSTSTPKRSSSTPKRSSSSTKRTGSTKRTRSVSRAASRVTARTGMTGKAARTQARKIVRKRKTG